MTILTSEFDMTQYAMAIRAILKMEEEEWIDLSDQSEYRNGILQFKIDNTRMLAAGDVTSGQLSDDMIQFRNTEVAELYYNWLADIPQSGTLHAYVRFGDGPSGMWMGAQIVRMDDFGRPTSEIFDMMIDNLDPDNYSMSYGAFSRGQPVPGYCGYYTICA